MYQVYFMHYSINYSIMYTFSVVTYDVQSIDITSTSGEVCVVCGFSTNTIAVGCELQLQNNNITQTERFHRDVNNIAEGCISNIISGYYDLYVYDVENNNALSQLPAIIKNQLFVDEETSTTTTSSTTTITTTVRLITVLASSLNSISPILSSSISSTS